MLREAVSSLITLWVERKFQIDNDVCGISLGIILSTTSWPHYAVDSELRCHAILDAIVVPLPAGCEDDTESGIDCELIARIQLCGNDYYSQVCCETCMTTAS